MKKYMTVEKYARTELEIKKSRFIASVKPVATEEEAKEFILQIKTEFKDASHNVFAYQVGLKNKIQRMSDDGEPQGTSGPPVLEVIKKEGLTNVVIVVSRYFGGTMLGAGGLIRAYGQTAKHGIDSAAIVERGLYQKIIMTVDYQQFGAVQHFLAENNHNVEDTEYTDVVKLTLYIFVEAVGQFKAKIIEFTNGNVELEQLGEFWR